MLNSKNTATLLTLIKWPTATLFLSFLPASAMLIGHELFIFNQKSYQFGNLLLGFSVYMLIWYFYIKKINISILSTFEHEITHCIFAWLTFNRVVSLSATLKRGGHMKFEGHANWLISVSPYFFPTLTFAILLISGVVGYSENHFNYIFVGASLGYHITSTFHETHHAQTDLQEVGFIFSILFLPTANLLCYSIVLAVLTDGWNGFTNCFAYLAQSSLNPFQIFLML